jgi:hypothetical protein
MKEDIFFVLVYGKLVLDPVSNVVPFNGKSLLISQGHIQTLL